MKLFYSTALTPAQLLTCALEAVGYPHPPAPPYLKRTERGKPYLAGDAPHFSLTHTKGLCAVAVGNAEVGLDAELKREVPKTVYAHLTPEEKEEDFFEVWTAKEAYVKLLGDTLASRYRTLRYCGGVLYENGAPLPVTLLHWEIQNFVLCLCTQGPTEAELIEL